MSKEKITIVNPVQPDRNITSLQRAKRFVRQGRAVWCGPATIRFTGNELHAKAAATAAAYDALGRGGQGRGDIFDWRGNRHVNAVPRWGGVFPPGEVCS